MYAVSALLPVLQHGGRGLQQLHKPRALFLVRARCLQGCYVRGNTLESALRVSWCHAALWVLCVWAVLALGVSKQVTSGDRMDILVAVARVTCVRDATA